MIHNNSFPLVRTMLAHVYNNSFMCTAPGHRDLGPEHITLEWVDSTTNFPCTEQSMFAAELFLGEQPGWAERMATLPDQDVPPELLLVAQAYCEHLGLH